MLRLALIFINLTMLRCQNIVKQKLDYILLNGYNIVHRNEMEWHLKLMSEIAYLLIILEFMVCFYLFMGILIYFKNFLSNFFAHLCLNFLKMFMEGVGKFIFLEEFLNLIYFIFFMFILGFLIQFYWKALVLFC